MAATISARNKILSLDSLVACCNEAREQGLTIVHCHGCFDIVHPGHVRHLEFAARQGDLLLVSITGDRGVGKGVGRPLIPEILRAENLAALSCVDWVFVDDHPTAVQLLERVRPDVYLKGQEYEHNRDPRFLAEKETVERHGGRVVFSSGDVVFSSSALISAMAQESDPFGRQLLQLAQSHDLRPSTLDAVTMRFTGKRIVVVGETIRDTYVHCEQPEVASESPVMTLRPMQEASYDGGAAIVAQHLAGLGAQVDLVTALGQTDVDEGMVNRLRARGVNVHWIDGGQPVVEKQRYLVGAQKLMKVDRGRTMALDERARRRFIELATAAATDGRRADAAILCDFGQGLFTPTVLDRVIDALRPNVPVMAGDVSGRRAHLMHMRHLDVMCPSETEVREAMGEFGEGLNAVVWRWMKATSTAAALVTMGEAGVIAFDRLPGSDRLDGWQTRLKGDHIPALGPLAVDPLGCGDALLATATLSLAAGANLVQAAYLGSLAAAIEARHVGNVPVGLAGLRAEWQRLATRHLQIASAV